MTTRRKNFYALEEDWPEVLEAFEEAVDIEYVRERAVEDWTFPRYRTWHDLPPLRKEPGEIFWRRYLIVSPPGQDVVQQESLEDSAKALGLRTDTLPKGGPDWRPQLDDSPGSVLFDPRGLDPQLSAEDCEFVIDEGWLATGHYDDEDSKLVFDGLVKAMQRRFANYKGTLFGSAAYRRIVQDGWEFGQGGASLEWDISTSKKPSQWKA